MVGFTTEVVVVLWLELVISMVKKELQWVHELSSRELRQPLQTVAKARVLLA